MRRCVYWQLSLYHICHVMSLLIRLIDDSRPGRLSWVDPQPTPLNAISNSVWSTGPPAIDLSTWARWLIEKLHPNRHANGRPMRRGGSVQCIYLLLRCLLAAYTRPLLCICSKFHLRPVVAVWLCKQTLSPKRDAKNVISFTWHTESRFHHQICSIECVFEVTDWFDSNKNMKTSRMQLCLCGSNVVRTLISGDSFRGTRLVAEARVKQKDQESRRGVIEPIRQRS